jgi:hypothetical protein
MPSFINRAEQNVVEELNEFSNIGPFGGVQSEIPLDQVEQFGQVDILNMSLRKSVAETRSGYTILPAYPDTPIEDTTGIADFYDNNAARIQVVMTLTRLIEWDSSAQDWAVITGALTGGPFDLFTWTVVDDKLCFCQGIDPIQLWDGITTTFGPSAPGVVTAAVVNIGGTGFVLGDTFTIPGGNGNFSGTVLTVSGTTVLTFAITNPGVDYAIGTGIVATATSGSGTGLTINITTVITASYPAKYLMELGTHLVIAYTIEGGTPHTQRVRWSGAGDPTDFTSPSSGSNDILGDLGPITGAVKIFQTGYIFHQWGVTQMIPTGVGTNPFQFVPLTTRARGNTVPYSLAPAGEEFACYIGKDNIYKFNGTNSLPIGDQPIANNKRIGARSRIFQDLSNTDPRSVVGYVSDTINGQVFPAYWIIMPQFGNTIIWVYNLDEQNWARFTFSGTMSTLGRFFKDEFTRWEDLVGTWADQTLDWDQFPGINPFDSVLLAFSNGVNGDFNYQSVSEQNWSMSGVFIMGDVRHSKTIKKFRICILDNGPVTFTVSLSNAVGQTVSQMVTMGSNSGMNISQILTLSISGIRINYSISGNAGQDFTLVEFAPMYSIGGEQRGGQVDA